MDSSSLMKAYDHAKAASSATHTADATVASAEHALAAGEFSNASQSTASVEALRILQLLEQHHRHLSELIKLSADSPVRPTATDGEDSGVVNEKTASGTDDHSANNHDKRRSGDTKVSGHGTSQKTGVPSLAQKQRRYPSRDLTSSIASNLASARGIRSKYRTQPLTPSISNTEAPGNVEVRPRREASRTDTQGLQDQTQSGKPAWIPPSKPATVKDDTRLGEAEATARRGDAGSPANDEGYSRFYNTFGSLLNRLSAPLAFAGLPLITEESGMGSSAASPEPPTSPPTQRHHGSNSSRRNRSRPAAQSTSARATDEPDWSRNFSHATKQALARDGHTNDSFYVVPTSGHTMSYANILTFAEKEKRRQEAEAAVAAADDDDDFVDAQGLPLAGMSASRPLSPGAKRKIGRSSRSDKDLHNTVEELYLENKSLKDMLDKLSRRLHAFEASAQNSSLALAESMRLMRPGSPLSGGSGSGHRAGPPPQQPASEEAQALRAKNKELEEQLALAITQMEGLERERRKTEKILAKYRDKWEKLKAGAKARREAQGGAVENIEDEPGQS